MTSMLNSFDEVCPEFCSDGANSMALNFVVALALVCAASSISPGEVLLRIHNPSGFISPAYPFTVGVPFPRGALKPDAKITLRDADGNQVPVQAMVTASWDKGSSSVRWLLLDFVMSLQPGGATLALQTKKTPVSVVPLGDLATKTADSILLDTGRVKLEVSRKGFNLFEQVWTDLNNNHKYESDEAVLDTDALRGPFLRNDKGKKFWAVRDPKAEIKLEENGQVKAVVMAKGFYTAADGARFCQFIVRITVHRDMPWVRTDQTFVYTEDSDKGNTITGLGCRLPLRDPAREYVLGTVDGEPLKGLCTPETVSLYQRDHDWFQLARYDGTKPLGVLREGKRGTGRISVRTGSARITAGVEDFWQQFPKELSADSGGLTVHFWPSHGEKHPRWKLPENAFEKLDENTLTKMLYPLHWVHEGPALSFKLPVEISRFGDRSSGTFRNIKRGRPANGMGVGKTHRVYFDFGHKDTAPPACPLDVGQQPYAHPDPEQIYASRVAGALWPRDPERFAAAERVLDGLGKWMASLPHKLNDYGMWHWISGHQYLIARTRLPSIARVWANTHDGRPRWPWVLFLRSGEPIYRAMALRMTRHCADIAICHYTTDEYNEGRNYASDRKKVGGSCDYKGLVTWHAGDRYTYNSGVDWYLWNYYMTGDRRSWDVAMEHGNYVASQIGGTRGRTASAWAATALGMYHATWEEHFLTRAATVLKEICLSIEEAEKKSYQSIPYHPHWERALDTPDLGKPLLERIRKTILLRAEDELSYGFSNSSTRFSHHKLMGLAYRLSADPRYLAWGDGMNRWLDWASYPGKDELFQGYVAWAVNLGTLSYYLQRIPYFLAARASHDGPVPDYTPRFMVNAASHLVVKKDWPAAEGTTRVWLKAGVGAKPLVFTVKDTQGIEVHRQQMTPNWSGRKHANPTIGFDFPDRLPPGEYSIELLTPQGGQMGIVPCLPLPKEFPFKKVVLLVPQMAQEQKFQFGRGVLYFFVPKGVEELKFLSRAADGGHIATLRIERPEGNGWVQVGKVKNVDWPDWRRFVAEVRPQDAGRIWRVFHASAIAGGTYHEVRLRRESPTEVPLVVADRLDRFFLPKTK